MILNDLYQNNNKQLDEINLSQIGRAVGKGVKGGTQAIGSLSKGVSNAIQKAYQSGKNLISDIPTSSGQGQTSLPYYGINPATKKPWTVDELQAKSTAATAVPVTPAAAKPTASTAGKPFALPQATSSTAGQPSKVTYGKGFEKKPATTQFPAFGTAGQAGGYAAAPTTTPGVAPAATKLPKPTTTKIAPSMPAAPANPVTAGGDVGTYNKKTGAAELGGKSMVAMKDLPLAVQKKLQPQLAEQVDKMLENVKTKRDIDSIRLFINKQFASIELTESTINQRKKLMDHVTKVSAIRRRLHARGAAN